VIIILGMAGAGKSTQCRILCKSGDYQWMAVGEFLRSIETGDNRAEMMHGKVLNDAVVTPLVRAELLRMGDTPPILLDGCPRTVGQAKWLTTDKETPRVTDVVHLLVSDTVALGRLKKRGREDDTDSAMKLRFAGYHRDIGHVLDVFRAAGANIHEINADEEEATVAAEIKKVLS
jgi:adenylate kinase family enzyme